MILFWPMLLGFLIIAILIAVSPFLKNRSFASLWMTIPIIVFLSGASLSLYLHYGSSQQVSAYKKNIAQEEKAKKLLSNLHSTAELIEKMQRVLKTHPQSSKGWFLLGRLYIGTNQFDLARGAFTRALQFNPNDLEIMTQLAQADFFANDQQLNQTTNKLIQQILEREPQNKIALNIVALDAFSHKDYSKAISVWQLVLEQVSPISEEGQIVNKAIENARKAQENK